MRSSILFSLFVAIAVDSSAQQNLLSNGSFEDYKTGYNGFVTITSGKAKGLSGKWQVVLAKGGCPTGCAKGGSSIVASNGAVGANALEIKIDTMYNRNDIRVFQSVENVPAGVYEVSFLAKSNAPALLSVDLLKSTQQITNNGAEPFMGLMNIGTEWKRYSFVADISTWTDEDRNEMRVSIRPNSHKALPTGPYPKTFWIDDVVFFKK
jgi:hypothetical protein